MSARPNAPRLVSAGAGSGKTWRIVKTIVDRVREGTSIEQIAAVTFTEAAATELQDRVRAGLLAAGLDAEAARVDVAAISTVHTFALTLLKRYPLAAGLPPEPVVLDAEQAHALQRRLLVDVLYHDDAQAMRATLERCFGPGVGLSTRGRGADETPEGRIQKLVRDVLDKGRSVAKDATSLEREADAAARRLFDAMGAEGHEGLLDADLRDGLTAAYAQLDKKPQSKFAMDADLYAALREMRASSAVASFDVAMRVVRCKSSKDSQKEFGTLLAAAGASVGRHPELRRRLGEAVRAVFSIASKVLAKYSAEKERMGAVDFEDMQLVALELIEGRRAGREAYAGLIVRSLPFIVVDEFQDTSPLQYRLFEALREAGATVTYVGDLKQGIYAFRTADAALFAALLERSERDGMAPESLDRSRRSRPELVALANGIFSAVMPPAGMPFVPLTADNAYTDGKCPKPTASIEVVIHPLSPKRVKLDAGVSRVVELIASGTPVFDRSLGEARPARYGDVTVLTYSNGALEDWSEALRAQGVSSVLAARGLFGTLEVQLARAWLAMLASPRDRSAAALVLLSELYGLSQRSVVRLTLAKVSGSPRRALELHDRDPVGLPLADFEVRALIRCRDDLQAGREALRQLPLPEAVERVFERVAIADRLAMRLDEARAAQTRANLAELVAVAHRLSGRGDVPLTLAGATGVTLENYLLALERAANDEPAQAVATDDTPNSVKLVTMHRSKGMEYPIVVLDALDHRLEVRLPRVEVLRPDDVEVMLGARALEASGLVVVPEVGIGCWRDEFRGYFGGALRERQEWLRLLYVAVTRARDHLVLLWPAEAKSGDTTYLRSLVTAHVRAPAAGDATWLGQRVSVTAVVRGDGDDEETKGEGEGAIDLSAWRALAEDDSPIAPVGAPRTMTPRLARVSPSELCQFADCPEVPGLMRFARGSLHHIARDTGGRVEVSDVPSAFQARVDVGDKLSSSRVGTLVHAAIERAKLLGVTDAARDLALARRTLEQQGEVENRDAMAALIVAALASLRGVAAKLGAAEEPMCEVPFVYDLEGTTLRGVVDLVVRGADGLHVVDLKTHPLKRPELGKWAAYYEPQLDAYALAVQKLTGERVVARHLAVPAAGALVTLPGGFDAARAEAGLRRLVSDFARGVRGPAPERKCHACGWKSSCGIGKTMTRGVAPDAEDG